jgi:hypothetical protein
MNNILSMSRSYGYAYLPKPTHLPKLDPLTRRLISPWIPYMQICRLRHEGSCGIIGKVINVPVDVDTMVRSWPWSLDDNYAFNVNLKRNFIHKSLYLSSSIKKFVVKAWLQYLIKQPLYKHYNITVDWSVFSQSMRDSAVSGTSATSHEEQLEAIKPLDANGALESKLIHARQHTVLWNEEHCLDIVPGQRRIPENIIYDTHAEELLFLAIYFGVGRWIKDRVHATPCSMCMSEIHRSDRHGVTPQHVLYFTFLHTCRHFTQKSFGSISKLLPTPFLL